MKWSKLFAIVLLIIMCASFISCTGEPVETQGTLVTDSSVSEWSTLELTEETSADLTELENTTKTTETTKTESSASETEPEITTASSAQSDIPITMAGAVDKPPAYELLQNEAGGYIGVRFTYEDGSTYTWECPVESVVPPIVLFDFDDNRSFAGTCLIEYATEEEALFNQVDLMHREILYRHQNEKGKKYTYGTGGYCHENGSISFRDGHLYLDKQGRIKYWGQPEVCYDTYMKRCTGKVREVRPLYPGESVPAECEFSSWISVVPEQWWEDNGVFYGCISTRDGQPVVRRMNGYDTLYYTAEPIENFADVALDIFQQMMEQEYGILPENTAYTYEIKTRANFSFSLEVNYWIPNNTSKFLLTDNPKLQNDLNIQEKCVDSMLIYIDQVSPHYFVKVETYNYDDYVVYYMRQNQAADMLYY